LPGGAWRNPKNVFWRHESPGGPSTPLGGLWKVQKDELT